MFMLAKVYPTPHSLPHSCRACLPRGRGLRKGDVIQEVNHQPVHNVSEFEQAMHKAGKEEALLLVNRGGTTLFIAA
jgi:S1-C subfamily serine protease